MSARSLKANGEAIRSLRLGLGFTQDELANISGYSNRLIRKAESGGQLDGETLVNLAASLSSRDRQVALNDIIVSADLRLIVEEWMKAFNESGTDLGTRTAHLLTDDFVFHCPGKPETAPFIGSWHGAEGLDRFWQLYLGVFRRIPNMDIVYAVSEDLVIARYLESGYLGDQFCGPIRVHFVFHFRDGKIYRIDDDYDTEGGATAKAAAEETLQARQDLAVGLLKAYQNQNFDSDEAVSGMLSDDFQLQCLANVDELPFVGIYPGVQGIKSFYERFFGILNRSGPLSIEYLQVENRIVANFADQFSINGNELEPIQLGMHFHYRDRVLFRIDVQIDHRNLKRQMDELKSD